MTDFLNTQTGDITEFDDNWLENWLKKQRYMMTGYWLNLSLG